MLQTSDIPATCFAVQGLGESHPAATNNTPEGRAANRRVEISLVPRTDACQDVKQNMLPEPALSQLNPQEFQPSNHGWQEAFCFFGTGSICGSLNIGGTGTEQPLFTI